MRHQFQLYDLVTITKDVPQHHLVSGQVGTIVEQYAPDAFDVEFVDNNGTTYALATLRSDQLLALSYEPAQVQAA